MSPFGFNDFQKCLLVLNGLQQICAAPSVVANRLQVKFFCLFLEHFLKGTERTVKKPTGPNGAGEKLFITQPFVDSAPQASLA